MLINKKPVNREAFFVSCMAYCLIFLLKLDMQFE